MEQYKTFLLVLITVIMMGGCAQHAEQNQENMNTEELKSFDVQKEFQENACCSNGENR